MGGLAGPPQKWPYWLHLRSLGSLATMMRGQDILHQQLPPALVQAMHRAMSKAGVDKLAAE